MLPDKIFHSSFDHSPIGQYLLAPTEKLEILAVNDVFLSSVSHARAEVEGQPETAPSVLIAVTGYGEAEDLQRSLQSGCDHHLVKPVDYANLNAVLERVNNFNTA